MAAAATSNTTRFIIPKPTEREKKNQLFFLQPSFCHVVFANVNVLFHLKEQLRLLKSPKQSVTWSTWWMQIRVEIKSLFYKWLQGGV